MTFTMNKIDKGTIWTDMGRTKAGESDRIISIVLPFVKV